MKLVDQHDPILRQKCNPFDFQEPIMDPYELSNELHKIRKEGAGVGLAAPQIGLNTQVLVIGMGNFQTEGAEDYDQVFFNPTITSTDGKDVYMLEGCLSFPGLFVKIKRPENITLEWYTEEDTVCNERFTGITSRILQHEVDHLSGLLFIRKAERYHLLKGQKDRKLQKRYRKRHKTDIILS
jgi:peptide deformylase